MISGQVPVVRWLLVEMRWTIQRLFSKAKACSLLSDDDYSEDSLEIRRTQHVEPKWTDFQQILRNESWPPNLDVIGGWEGEKRAIPSVENYVMRL